MLCIISFCLRSTKTLPAWKNLGCDTWGQYSARNDGLFLFKICCREHLQSGEVDRSFSLIKQRFSLAFKWMITQDLPKKHTHTQMITWKATETIGLWVRRGRSFLFWRKTRLSVLKRQSVKEKMRPRTCGFLFGATKHGQTPSISRALGKTW